MESLPKRNTPRPLAAVAAGVMAGVLLTFAIGVMAGSKPKDKILLGEKDVKELLLLMDTDQNGKISKAEYMHFMEAEFDRLDVDHSGELDVKELTQASFRVVHSGHR